MNSKKNAEKIPFLYNENIPVETSINNLKTSFVLAATSFFSDIPDDLKTYLGDWVLIATFGNGSTATQYITSLFAAYENNRKIFKRHKASGNWSGFYNLW